MSHENENMTCPWSLTEHRVCEHLDHQVNVDVIEDRGAVGFLTRRVHNKDRVKAQPSESD